MQWHTLIFICSLLSSTIAEPDPKKYKPDIKEKDADSSLTEEERTFLREVESKFGIKSDIPLPSKGNNANSNEQKPTTGFPTVIAIEIVNDTDTKTKGKRTIDANLGYGYRTNNGYMYTYFGKPTQEKGKFMIYPYSQQDIPPARTSHFKDSNGGYSSVAPKRHQSSSTNVVDIQPSQAYELVPVKEEEKQYENSQGLVSPPPPYPESLHRNPATASSTLYTTYNGHQFSGLQGQFPTIMSNYLVDPTELLQNPQYQNAGLTQDHLQSHGTHLEQRVVPVLVLRIPSSYLKNPTAELYANLPQNYPLSQHLNHINFQELVNQYFKKLGYSYAPQINTYSNPEHQQPAVPVPVQAPIPVPVSNYQPHHYSSPYVRPTYTQADYSGVQYSAVQPVMAKYPTQGYSRPQYYTQHVQPQYEQPAPQQQYEYKYHYVPQHAVHNPEYYVRQQYQSAHYQSPYAVESVEQSSADIEPSLQDAAASAEQEVSQENSSVETKPVYGAPKEQPSAQQYITVPDYGSRGSYQQYESTKEESLQEQAKQLSQTYGGPTKVPLPAGYSPPKPSISYQQYAQQLLHSEDPRQSAPKEAVASYISYPQQSVPKYSVINDSPAEGYVYSKESSDEIDTKTSVVISENYPSKDHTHAVPYRYKSANQQSAVQSVSYVTPVPHATAKYHSQFKVMVPQTVLKHQESKVSYVNSHSLPSQLLQVASQSGEYNPEQEYSAPPQYAPPVGSQKAPSYPKNYHIHPKRMVRPKDNKPETTKLIKKDSTPPMEKKEKKQSS